jgi:hypothetical protein
MQKNNESTVKSVGKCFLCDSLFDRKEMIKHLKKCRQENDDFEEKQTEKSSKSKIFHLFIEGKYNPEYWLHIDIQSDVTLSDLDDFLREIWVECCDHLSTFEINKTNYSYQPMEELDEESMNYKIDKILSTGMKFSYEYDFGSTTYINLKVISDKPGILKDSEILVLARNEQPFIPCYHCGGKSTQVCVQCIDDEKGWICDNCIPKHECEEDLLSPVVNSPRVGVCGYVGGEYT